MMTVTQFLARFPEFRQVPDTQVQAALDAAWSEMDTVKVWKTWANEGQAYLAAHKLSIGYEDPQDPNIKNYLKEFDRLKKGVTMGFRVA